MPKLVANFAEVPDAFVKVGAGIYKFNVKKAVLEASTNADTLQKDPSATNLQLEATVVNECPFKDRVMKRTISTKMLTEIKRLAMSAGISKQQIESEGVDTDLLVGKDFYGEVKSNTYVDKNKVQQEGTQLANFLIPGDAGYASV